MDDNDLIAIRRALGVDAGPLENLEDTDDVVAAGDPVDSGVSGARRSISSAALSAAALIVGGETSDRLDHVILKLQSGARLHVNSATSIGRSDLERPSDGRVSRRHAQVERVRRGLVLTDLGSANGTFRVRDGVVTQVVSEPVELQVGDRITTIDDVLIATVVEGDDDS